ncbi:MAG: Rrf2 family transcriptional regulator [Phycisphaerae bacterium]
MICSRTAVHGIYALCYLSRQQPGSVLSSAAVAAALGITREHASKVLKRLASVGVVSSVRGRQGGYALIRKMEEISLIEVLDALNPSQEESRLRAQSCREDRAELCNAHRGLLHLEDRMRKALAGETLGGLAGSLCTIKDASMSARLACRPKRVCKAVAVS